MDIEGAGVLCESLGVHRVLSLSFALASAPAVLVALAGCTADKGDSTGSTTAAGTTVGTGAAAGVGGASNGGTGSGGAAGSGSTDAGSMADAAGAAGSDGSADGDTGAGTGPVMPVQRNGRWALDLGDLSFEVDPLIGGRVTTFALASVNLLTGPDVNVDNWGSTFWTSPQSVWNWPPPPQIDNQPYTVNASATALVVTGTTSPAIGVSVTKTFSLDRAVGAVRIDYSVTNQSQMQVRLAPWEVTRVVSRGLTFFPTGTRSMISAGGTLPTTNSGGVTWFAYDAATILADSKLYADGAEGWLAHVAQGLVFIKRFVDVPANMQAPGEGDVELFTNLAHTYIELEDQGAYGMLAPQSSASWTVTWYLKRLPADIAATTGNAALVQFVRDTIR
jgi:hypothetical protein